MVEKIFSSVDEFDKIDLGFEELGADEKKPIEEIESLEDIEDLETKSTAVQPSTNKDIQTEVPNLDAEIEEIENDNTVPEKDHDREELETLKETDPIQIEPNEPEPTLDNIQIPKDESDINDEIYDPKFDISKIKTTKYQTRKTERSDKDKIELAEKIRLQGQLEPVHIVKEPNGEYQLVAGFGRVESMLAIGIRTVKAIIHLKFDLNEIMKVSFGTNEGRTELSDWDKICSVGTFVKNNPLFPLDDADDPNSVVKIFGYSKETIYKYIKFYKYFITQPDYLNLFRIKRFPVFVYSTLYDFRGDILKAKPVVEYLLKNDEFTASKFKLKIADIAASVKIQEKVSIENEQTKDQVDESKKIAKELLSKITEEERKAKSDVEKKLQEIILNLGNQKELIRNLLEVSDLKKYVDAKQFKDLNRVIKEITQLHLKLV